MRTEKIAVLRATRSPPRAAPARVFAGRLLGGFCGRGQGRYSTALRGAYRRLAARAQSIMANIHSQKKRILRAERERLENRLYTSTIKTYFRRLEAAVAGGDDAGRRHRAPDARQHDRQGRQARRPAPQHGRPQEEPRRPHSRRQLLLTAQS